MSKNPMFLLFFSLILGSVNLAYSTPPSLTNFNEAFVFEPIFQSKIYLFEAGLNNKISVVLIHGVGEQGARIWDYIIPELAEQYHVVAFDLPGFGRSSKKNSLYSPTLYAAFVKWVVDRYVNGPFVVIGHSLGGAVALRFASTYQRDLQRLILIDVAGILHQAVLAQNIAQSKLSDWSQRMKFPPLDLIVELSKRAMDRLPKLPIDPEVALGSASLRQKFLNGDPVKIAGLALSNENFSGLIELVAVPTRILWGADDSVTPIRIGKVLEYKIPNARLTVMPNAGHSPMLQQPAQFNKLILTALSTSQIREPAFKPLQSDRMGRCDNKNGVLFRGPYRHIDVVNSRNVRLIDVTAESLTISDSEVLIESSHIEGNEVGIKLNHSSLTATSVSLVADIAILASKSSMDLDGVKLFGRKAVLQASDNSTIIFSVSDIKSPFTSGTIHGRKKITPSNPL